MDLKEKVERDALSPHLPAIDRIKMKYATATPRTTQSSINHQPLPTHPSTTIRRQSQDRLVRRVFRQSPSMTPMISHAAV